MSVGGWGLECLCDTERETERNRRRAGEREEPVCSFHLLISFPGGSIIDCSRGGKQKAEKEDGKFQTGCNLLPSQFGTSYK